MSQVVGDDDGQILARESFEETAPTDERIGAIEEEGPDDGPRTTGSNRDRHHCGDDADVRGDGTSQNGIVPGGTFGDASADNDYADDRNDQPDEERAHRHAHRQKADDVEHVSDEKRGESLDEAAFLDEKDIPDQRCAQTQDDPESSVARIRVSHRRACGDQRDHGRRFEQILKSLVPGRHDEPICGRHGQRHNDQNAKHRSPQDVTAVSAGLLEVRPQVPIVMARYAKPPVNSSRQRLCTAVEHALDRMPRFGG